MRKPDAMFRNWSGKGEICVFPRVTIVAPRKISMPASVTMNAGIPTNATQ